jgi:hypothetical protein
MIRIRSSRPILTALRRSGNGVVIHPVLKRISKLLFCQKCHAELGVCPGPVVTPIFRNTKPPDIAITAEEAARIALEDVANLQGIASYLRKSGSCGKAIGISLKPSRVY